MDSNSMSDWQDFFTFVGLVAGGLTAWALLVAALPVQTLARYPSTSAALDQPIVLTVVDSD